MGAKNAVTKHYLSNSVRFAELFNNEIFQGKSMIHPEKLRSMDPEEWGSVAQIALFP